MEGRIVSGWPPHANLRMKKPQSGITRLLFAVVFALMSGAGAPSAAAQFRLDASLCFLESPVPTAFAEAGWQFITGNLHAGIGLDALVAIALNVFWPDAFLEYELDPLILRADLGGGLIYRFGFGTVDTSPNLATMVIPQIDFSFKLTDWMRVGVGVLAFEALESTIGSSVVAYLAVRIILCGSKHV